MSPSPISNLPSPSSTRSTGENEVLVKVEGVSKKFCRSLKKSLWYGVKDMAAEVVGGKGNHEALRDGEFWAVNDVSFELRRGECLGLIGRNGAGKTTLLKLLNGLIKPDHGRIEMRGRVGALIALGAGFNPILTGRENIYVNGSVLGLTRQEIQGKIAEIIEFAEIGDFIDTPVQSYSSGMLVRLGFAVATAIEPDIVILDEVLAVGDASFRAKCFKRMGSVLRNCAILFVSHDSSQVSRVCTKALLLEHGSTSFHGKTEKALALYRLSNQESRSERTVLLHDSILSVDFSDVQKAQRISTGDALQLRIGVESRHKLEVGLALLSFFDCAGNPAGQVDFSNYVNCVPSGTSILLIQIQQVDLAQGDYSMNLAMFGKNSTATLIHGVNVSKLSVNGSPYFWCAYKMPLINATISSGHL